MGGPGSGRWGGYTKRRTVEGCRVLRVRDIADKLREEGVTGEGFTLTCKVETSAGPQAVTILREPARLGGFRLWLLCPRCETRRLRLYLLRGVYACRVCHGLTYTSSQETHKYDRLFRILAADIGPGWTPQAVKASLKETHTKRDLTLLDAVIGAADALGKVGHKGRTRR